MFRNTDRLIEPAFSRAIARRPGRSLGGGITTANEGQPDHALACKQFERYVGALDDAGLDVTVLEPLEEFPDAHFVEDTAVMLPDGAVLCRPGADARRGEAAHMEPVLAGFGRVLPIEEPGTLDGGDVLQIGSHFLVGVSERTNGEGARQLAAILDTHGFTCDAVPVAAGLHFKSSVNHIGGGVLLVSRDFAGHEALDRYEQITVEPDEEYACNCLALNDRVLVPDGFPNTRRRLEDLGRQLVVLDTSEFRKMDGGLTCLSLRF